jgi:hypothetical protein
MIFPVKILCFFYFLRIFCVLRYLFSGYFAETELQQVQKLLPSPTSTIRNSFVLTSIAWELRWEYLEEIINYGTKYLLAIY